MDEVFNPLVTIKTTGHQWYWSYEYSDFINIEFDSYINNQSTQKTFRLIDSDNSLIIPIFSQIRNLITAGDVIHSWTIPRLGVKVDAVPGRLNQINFSSQITGLLFGQCSEICGANHRFMPISLIVCSPKLFIKWIINFYVKKLMSAPVS
jgi:cytochrome c oxidase subunit 2